MSPINGLSSTYLQSVLSPAFQGGGVNLNGATSTQSPRQADRQQLSPFAQLLGTLQQLQQSDPAKYVQVTSQIATKLQSAAQTALSQGKTAAADQLNQLATDFADASKTGQMPNIQGLAQAAGAHHHHHHGHASPSGSSSSQSQAADQLLSAFQMNPAQQDPLQPLSIISSELASAGVATSNS